MQVLRVIKIKISLQNAFDVGFFVLGSNKEIKYDKRDVLGGSLSIFGSLNFYRPKHENTKFSGFF